MVLGLGGILSAPSSPVDLKLCWAMTVSKINFAKGGRLVSVAEKIKEIRQQSLMSQSDFANALGVSFSTVNRWENGKTLPTYRAMNSLEQFCKEKTIDFSKLKIEWKG